MIEKEHKKMLKLKLKLKDENFNINSMPDKENQETYIFQLIIIMKN